MNSEERLIGVVLRIGLWLSVLVVLIGGIFYLIQCGGEPIQYQIFQKKSYINNCSARHIIDIGLLFLVFTQIFRVLLTAWLFFNQKDYFFTSISLLIFSVLIYSIFLRFL